MQEILTAGAGHEIPILITEIGRNDGRQAANMQITADFVTQMGLRVPVEAPFVKGIWWYELEDHTSIGGSATGYGLVRQNHVRKPVFFAFQEAAAAALG